MERQKFEDIMNAKYKQAYFERILVREVPDDLKNKDKIYAEMCELHQRTEDTNLEDRLKGYVTTYNATYGHNTYA